jgi:hypothetical protein
VQRRRFPVTCSRGRHETGGAGMAGEVRHGGETFRTTITMISRTLIACNCSKYF